MSKTGLRGVAVGETSLSTVGDGHNLYYRGYSIDELAEHTTFEEVAYLLLRGELPTAAELAAYHEHLLSLRDLPVSVIAMLEVVPASAQPMDVTRVAVDSYGIAVPETVQNPATAIATTERLLANLPGMLCHWYRHAQGLVPHPSAAPGVAASFLEMLYGQPATAEHVRALDKSLILYAEHEFNASTFAARVVAATRADTYAAVSAAVGALKGPLHGGANEAALALIRNLPDAAAAVKAIDARLAAKELIMGFGHAVYKTGDPRNDVIKEISRALAETHTDGHLYEVSVAVEQTMRERKGMFPNLDFYSASAYHFMDIPVGLFTPLFACSRVAGWGAHIAEQRTSNRLIRPSADYVGPLPRTVLEINARG